MTLKEISTIIADTMIETQKDIERYAEIVEKVVTITAEVLDAVKTLEGVKIEEGDKTRGLEEMAIAGAVIERIKRGE